MEDLAVSDTYSSVASGRYALTQSVADAAALLCSNSIVSCGALACAVPPTATPGRWGSC
jgi:hypothetical protein